MTKRQISCQRARTLMPAYLDRALTLGEREQLEAHLSVCPACTSELANLKRLDGRTRLALRSVVESYTLTPQREAQIRRSLLASATSSQRRRWPRVSLGGAVAAIAAVLLVLSAGIATLRPTPPPSETHGFVSYASGPVDRDLLFSENGRPALKAAPVTITFVDGTLSPSDYASLIKRFQASNTDVTIEVRAPDSTQNDASSLAAQGDCFVASADISSPLVRDQLRPLTLFTQADAQIHIDDFFPAALAPVRFNDQLYGLPRTAQVRLAFFDIPTLRERGVAPPTADWTSDELAERVGQLQQQLPAGTYAFVPYDGYDAAYLLNQRGGRAPLNANVHLDNPTTIAAVNWYADLVRSDSSDVLALNDPQHIAQRQQIVAANRAAIWSGPPVARAAVTGRLGIVPLPRDSAQPSALQADAYFISKQTNTARVGACWRWIRFLSFQTFAWERVPTRISHVKGEAFVQQFGQQQMRAILQTLNQSTLTDPWTPTTVAALTDVLDDVTQRGASPRTALLRVQRYLEMDW